LILDSLALLALFAYLLAAFAPLSGSSLAWSLLSEKTFSFFFSFSFVCRFGQAYVLFGVKAFSIARRGSSAATTLLGSVE
jgi:hypothetical protein